MNPTLSHSYSSTSIRVVCIVTDIKKTYGVPLSRYILSDDLSLWHFVTLPDRRVHSCWIKVIVRWGPRASFVQLSSSWSRVNKQHIRLTDTGPQRLRLLLVMMMMMRIRTTRADSSRCGLLAHWEWPPVFSRNGLWRSLVVCSWHLVTTSQPTSPPAAAASSHHRRHVYARHTTYRLHDNPM